jgi:hypothetical protein
MAKSGGAGRDIFFLSDWIQDETRSAKDGAFGATKKICLALHLHSSP